MRGLASAAGRRLACRVRPHDVQILATVLLSLVVVLAGAWLVSAAVVFVRALRRGSLLQRGDMHAPVWKRLVLAFCALPLILLMSAGIVLNTIVFVCAVCWYRLRGKPLPTALSPRDNRHDHAA